MKTDRLFIVMPAYNEEANIEAVIESWHPIAEKAGNESRILVVNDGSTDKTGELLAALKEKYPLLITVDQENAGHGAALLKGYHRAIAEGADYIFQTDSDGQTIAGDFRKFWDSREKKGMQLGYRADRKDGLYRKFVSAVLRLLIYLSFGVWTRDANTPYRLMKSRDLKKVLEAVPENYYLANVLITVIYQKKDLGVTYYPVTFLKRRNGKSTFKAVGFWKTGIDTIKSFSCLRKVL